MPQLTINKVIEHYFEINYIKIYSLYIEICLLKYAIVKVIHILIEIIHTFCNRII